MEVRIRNGNSVYNIIIAIMYADCMHSVIRIYFDIDVEFGKRNVQWNKILHACKHGYRSSRH